MSTFKPDINSYTIEQLNNMESDKLVELYKLSLEQLQKYTADVVQLKEKADILRQHCKLLKSSVSINYYDSIDDSMKVIEKAKNLKDYKKDYFSSE